MTRRPANTFWRRLERHILVAGAASILSVSAFGQGISASECGVLDNPLGPFDYRKARYMSKRGVVTDRLLRDVEINHFRIEIENLTRAGTSTFGGDLNYVLTMYPNHHRALATMARLGKKQGTDKPTGAPFVVECYFERALRFLPDDHIARGLYANFLIEANRSAEAEKQLDRAAYDAKNIAIAQHNVGLLYLRNGNVDKALHQAHVAQSLGFDISRLQRLLEEKGAWKAAEVAAERPGSPASGAASRP